MAKKTLFRGVQSLGDRKYLARWKATDPKTGSQIDYRQLIEDCPSAQKAAAIRAELIEKAAKAVQGPVPSERSHLGTFAGLWLLSKKSTLAKSTYDRYESNLDLHIVPRLGHYFIDAITPLDVVAWRDSLIGLMDAVSINTVHRTLRTLMTGAQVQFNLATNPAKLVAVLREDSPYTDEEPNSLTSEELTLFLDATLRHRPTWYPLFATLAMTGCRICEVSALKWIDVVWPTGTAPGKLRVRRSHVRGDVRERTKTDTNRDVPLPVELAAILEGHKGAVEARKILNHATWVFPSTVGKPIIHSSARNALLRVLKKIEEENAGVPGFTIHGLRRTLNNLLREHASREVAKAIIGHTTDAMHTGYSTVRIPEKLKGMNNVLQLVRVPA